MRFFITLVPGLLAVLAAHSESVPKTPSPAQVSQAVAESDLVRITLTLEAEKRLGIVTEPVKTRESNRTRLFGGEIILPLTSRSQHTGDPSTSPVGLLQATTPAELLRLAQAQIDADVQVEQARIQVEVAEKALVRARQMLQDKAGAVRVVDEAKGQFDSTESALKAAKARRELLGPALSDAGHLPRLWIRTAVYVGDLDHLDEKAEVQVGRLSGEAVHPPMIAHPVDAFPSANAGAASVDLFYELASTNGPFRLGQRVGVTIPFRDRQPILTVPWSAVVQDVSGSTWVYERIQPQTFVRRRVSISRIHGAEAELSRGLDPGTAIVTAGAAELFGTEFGVGK